MEEYMLPCMNKYLFGVECAGCGAQRAFLLVLQGDFTAAFKMYPAVYTLIILFLFLIVNIFLKFKNDWFIKMGLILINAIIISGAYILKMSHLYS